MKKFEQLIANKILFDSHAHLGYAENIPELIVQAKEVGIGGIVSVSVDFESADQVTNALKKVVNKDFVLQALGIHPENFIPGTDLNQKGLSTLLPEQNFTSFCDIFLKRVASLQYDLVGECGLDWYWIDKLALDLKSALDSKRIQKLFLEFQLTVAKEFDLFVSLHTRDSFSDTYQLVNSLGLNKIIFHSFTGNYVQAKTLLDKGYYLGFNGILTYSSAGEIREMLSKIMGKMPNSDIGDFYDKHILFETDAPLLRPSNANTKGNVPANVVKIFEFAQKLIK